MPNISDAVGQVIQAIREVQAKPLPPPNDAPADRIASAEILGEDPGRRRPLSTGGAGEAVRDNWNATAAGDRRLEIIRGNGQVARVDTNVAVPPAIRVTDGFGRPVPGVTVKFEAKDKDGKVKVTTVPTDDDGVASARTWTLAAVGPNDLVARVDQRDVTFRALAVRPIGSQPGASKV